MSRNVPASLIARVFSLDMGALMAGAKYKGEYEERIKCVLNEVEKAAADGGPGVILFIDELHLIMAGHGSEVSGMDAANLFKPLLARGKLRRIVATTLAEYHKYIETDAALEHRFAQVSVNEPTIPETISIIRGIREKYEVHHGMRILNGALIAVATLARCYLTARWLPDSAINLVDEACARSMLLNAKRTRLQKSDCTQPARPLQKWTRESLPSLLCMRMRSPRGDEVNRIQEKIDELKAKADEAERRYYLGTASDLRYYALPGLQHRLEFLITKQGLTLLTPDHIAEIVARWTSIPVTRLMFTEKEKLLRMENLYQKAVVGQPEAIKAIANAIRLSYAMNCIDGSEYSEKHSISRLIGAPPGYVRHDSGGQLTEYVRCKLYCIVRRKPYCIILIDKIEKASRKFVTLFLQLLDDGRLTGGQGWVVDFCNTVSVMTGNLGAAYAAAIQAHFLPEFIDRVDEIIIFMSGICRGSMCDAVADERISCTSCRTASLSAR
ncbi:P-loop containing nucleoside triphosphate hydrolase protein [Russula earlei]|uniref:P-loop containing nucleoside triphosphate hydrolase protein n=1 Tax=Russula earlei TaxID=71964 RepID=A0ACC0U5H2_9AGAM|nr:P-loop containing nucleoside triphosphate hydrolase protein [Russula earlei]